MKIPAGENVLHLVDQVGTRAGIITEVGEINRVVRGAAAHGAVGTAQGGMDQDQVGLFSHSNVSGCSKTVLTAVAASMKALKGLTQVPKLVSSASPS